MNRQSSNIAIGILGFVVVALVVAIVVLLSIDSTGPDAIETVQYVSQAAV